MMQKKKQLYGRGWLLLFFWISIYFCELVMRIAASSSFWGIGLLLSLLYAFVPAMVLFASCRLFSQSVNRVLELLSTFLIFLFFAAQFLYNSIFNCYFSVFSMGNGGQAMQFWRVVLHTAGENWLPLATLFFPFLLHCIFCSHFRCNGFPAGGEVALFALAIILHYGVTAMLPLFGTERMSAYDLYHHTNDLNSAAEQLGLIPAFRLDFHRLLFGFDGEKLTLMTDSTTTESAPEEATEWTLASEAPADTSPNLLDIDFSSLIADETNETVLQLHQYFSSRTPSAKNEKTGLFKNCNLILLTAEGFSHLAIDPELTPVLYRLQTEGFYFTNFYTGYWGVSTSDGEYVALTGTIPKSGTWSFSKSSDNAMPLVMAQQLKRLGYSAYAYHNHSYRYYDRDESHPNLGYVYRGLGNGLEVAETWPESDLEMIDKTTADYMDREPFHAYYMTVSGHLEYNFSGNFIANKNRSLVEGLPYSDDVRAYLACQIELDHALELLLERLEKAGIAENTVIALTADHYPYGLTNEEQSELAGHPLEEHFELYRNACIIYKQGMEPERVDTPCSSLDLLPTLSNLFGLEFDSRFYMGRDVFSNAPPLVILRDHSWMTDRASYYAPTGELTTLSGDPLSEEEVQQMNDEVSNRFTVSAWVLEQDYWRILFGDNLPPEA